MAPKPSPKPHLTHFLCVPLVTASSASRWRASLDKFTADATNARSGADPTSQPPLPVKAIRPLHSLHLTLGVMSLENSERIEEATRALQEADVKGMLAEIEKRGKALEESENGKETSAELEAHVHETPYHLLSQIPPIMKIDSQLTDLPNQSTSSNPEMSTDPSTTHTAASVPSPNSSSQPTQPLHLSLRSLHPMHTASRTSVLYASPEDATSRLSPFCSQLRDHFDTRSLLVPDNRPLKLHATIVNTLHARSDARRGGASGANKRAKAARKLPKGWGRPERATNPAPAGENGTGEGQANDDPSNGSMGAMDWNGRFDARDLIERWDGFVWAEVAVDRVAICEMGARPGEDGEVRYREVAVVEL